MKGSSAITSTNASGDFSVSVTSLQNVLQYPDTSLDKHATGTVFVSFVVDELGSTTDAATVKSCKEVLDQEPLRLIRLMPWWDPGRTAGKPVRVARTLPVPFAYRAAE